VRLSGVFDYLDCERYLMSRQTCHIERILFFSTCTLHELSPAVAHTLLIMLLTDTPTLHGVADIDEVDLAFTLGDRGIPIKDVR